MKMRVKNFTTINDMECILKVLRKCDKYYFNLREISEELPKIRKNVLLEALNWMTKKQIIFCWRTTKAIKLWSIRNLKNDKNR
jgi:hypothetical protein